MATSHTAGRTPVATPTSEYATPAEVSARWSVTADYLARQRYDGTGPQYLKIGRRVRYRWADILAFEAENMHARTA
ncbi:DNA-binding protein [Nocardia salmonicida]|uniref:helix-turn-helix transcriptional regulator n=1 Tax=Nocardia salmonicida TaxID=53431 RepID=UPI0033C5FC86